DAARVEQETMVHTAHRVTLVAPDGQGRAAMAATVVEGVQHALRIAPEQYALAANGAREQVALRYFVIPGGHVPAILDKHFPSPIPSGPLAGPPDQFGQPFGVADFQHGEQRKAAQY